MENFPLSTGTLHEHRIEFYTSSLIVVGSMVGPFQRTLDLVNRRDRENLIVDNVTLAPIGQNATPKPIGESIFVARPYIHFAVALPTPENITDPHLSGPLTAEHTEHLAPSGPLGQRGLLSPNHLPAGQRAFQVSRIPKPCYLFTSAFVISGLCHLLEGSTIENHLDAQDTFFPLTQALIYLQNQPSVTWRRELIFVNKHLVQAIYTSEPRAPRS